LYFLLLVNALMAVVAFIKTTATRYIILLPKARKKKYKYLLVFGHAVHARDARFYSAPVAANRSLANNTPVPLTLPVLTRRIWVYLKPAQPAGCFSACLNCV
jgi:hypothetical protein